MNESCQKKEKICKKKKERMNEMNIKNKEWMNERKNEEEKR